MKITCQRAKLLDAYQTVSVVAPARSPKEILRNVKLNVTTEGATLLATDLEVGIRYDVSGIEVQRPGDAVLPVEEFGKILRESADETIDIEVHDGGVTVKGDRSKFNLRFVDPTDFPQVKSFEQTNFIEVPARLFRELIRRTLFATDNESSRYALGGVLLNIESDSITAVATDGRRLAKMTGAIPPREGFVPPEGVTIVPSRAMHLLERSIHDNDAEIQVAVQSNDILVKSPRATIHAGLLEGRFPRWQDVFPSYDGGIKLDLVVSPLHSAVRQAAIATSEESRGVNFTFADGSLVLSGNAADVGQSRIEMPIAYDGEEVTVKLDPRFVGDFLKVLDPERSFSLELKDGDNAVLCATDDGYAYVIMPLARDR